MKTLIASSFFLLSFDCYCSDFQDLINQHKLVRPIRRGDVCVCAGLLRLDGKVAVHSAQFLILVCPAGRDGRNGVVHFSLLVLSAIQFPSSGGCCPTAIFFQHTHTQRVQYVTECAAYVLSRYSIRSWERVHPHLICLPVRTMETAQKTPPPLSVHPSVRLQK